jgi:hypothetical protein
MDQGSRIFEVAKMSADFMRIDELDIERSSAWTGKEGGRTFLCFDAWRILPSKQC